MTSAEIRKKALARMLLATLATDVVTEKADQYWQRYEYVITNAATAGVADAALTVFHNQWLAFMDALETGQPFNAELEVVRQTLASV